MELHYIADDLREHTWYVELFVGMIAEVEAFAARWAVLEHLVTTATDDAPDLPKQ